MAAIVIVLAGSVLSGCGEGGVPAEHASPERTETSAGQGTPAPGALELTEVGLIMDWLPWVLDIPIDVAQAKGLYAARGLTVEQITPVEATDVVKFVSTGKCQFGLYYSPDVLMALEEGAGLLSLGSLMAHAPVGMALGPGFTSDSPAALAGKVASVPLIPSTRASLGSMLAAADVDADNVRLVDPGFDLVAPLLAGKVDAAAFTEFGELVQAERQGQELTYLDFRDWGTPDFAFLNVITTQEFARANPNTTRAFLQATMEGLAYAATAPEEAVSIYVEAHPELDEELLLAQWEAAVPSLALPSTGHPAGWQDMESWQRLSRWMQEVGLLKGTVDPASAVSNDYLDGLDPQD